MTVFPWPVTTTDEDSDFVTRLPFPPDGFQRAAFSAIDADHSVLVSAPTGSGKTLVAASSLDEGVRAHIKGGGNIAASKVVGKIIAERALAAGIELVVFDRGGYQYHGRVQALAEAAREAGLKF